MTNHRLQLCAIPQLDVAAMSEFLGVAATIRKPIQPEPLRALIAQTLGDGPWS